MSDSVEAKENSIAEYERLKHKFSLAKANRVYLEQFRKSKKALLMKEAERGDTKLSAAAQEREAYAHPEYIEVLKGLKEAVEEESLCYHTIKIIEMRFETWRTKAATRRAEMNMR